MSIDQGVPATDRRSSHPSAGSSPTEGLPESKPFPRDAALHHLFARQVAERPDALAVRHDDAVLTYAELDRAADALARTLAGAGVAPGGVVGVLAHRSIQSVVGMVAVLKTGAAYVPLDPEYPPERLAFLLEDAAPAAVLVQAECKDAAAKIEGYPGAMLDLPRTFTPVAPAGAPVDDGGVDGGARAYLIYTSGTTGRPKGVECTHRGLARICWDKADWGFPADGVNLHVTSLSFDPSQHELWATLLNGGCLVVLSDPTPSLDRIADMIARYDVTFAALSTGLFHLMVDHKLDGLKPLKWIQVGGDVMSPAHAATARAALPDLHVINAYGPTENGVITCRYDLTAEGWAGGPVPIGRGVAHTSVRILDDEMNPVAPGAVGQLCAGGDGVAIGYLKRPDLTAEKFVADPFSDTPGARLYLTGDLARIDENGFVEFHGRVDRQVKINGKRVELDEIENGLREDAALADAIVALTDAGNEVKRIAAYVKPAEALPDDAAARDALARDVIGRFKDRFPAHMIPADVVVMNVFPLTAAGKVDRAKLPDPRPAKPAAAEAGPAPAPVGADASIEEIVADIWRTVLKIERVGLDDNFFDLGGTSILLVKVHAQIQERLKSSVDLPTLFDKPKVRDLAAYLRASQSGGPAASGAPAAGAAARADKRAQALARARQARRPR